jgi:glucose uptake protein
MYEPQTYGAALCLMITAMLCWGSWANTMKLVPSWPFQLFYWDYVVGLLLVSIAAGLTLGSTDDSLNSFWRNLAGAGGDKIAYGLAAGAVFNMANLLLVAAISIAGLAVAFPIGIGLALVVGVILNYVLAPAGNPLLLFGGVALVGGAIVVDAMAFRARDAQAGRRTRGIGLSILCGLLMGSFFPLVTHASSGRTGLGPYAVAFVFALGVLACSIPVNFYLMRRPITADPPTSLSQYFSAGVREHFAGVAGGAIWGVGAISSFVAAHAAIVGPATSYAMGQGATMISAAWGVFLWREFAHAPPKAKRLLAPMFILFIFGLTAVAVAPLFRAQL